MASNEINIHYGALQRLDAAMRKHLPHGQSKSHDWLAAECGISKKSVGRHLTELQERLGAPVDYDRKEGYHYIDAGWIFPERMVSVDVPTVHTLVELATFARDSGRDDLAARVDKLCDHLGPPASRTGRIATVLRMLERAQKQGHLTYSDLDEMLDPTVVDPRELEQYLTFLRSMDVPIKEKL